MLLGWPAPRSHRVDRQVGRTGGAPLFDIVEQWIQALGDPVGLALHPQRGRITPGFDRLGVDDGLGLVELWARPHHRKPSVAKATGAPVRPWRPGSEPHRDAPLNGQRSQAGTGHALTWPVVADGLFGPQAPHQGDLLFAAGAAVRKVLT